ncbi:uncharacterized protein LOC116615008 isoform X2 [Nematostella vectensis]|uniref:uncharacterized protein LOC116615008 isoform X2 n=1 Tax=Nematostella vectensis TaxID=45351 RepID=UPI002077485B|nr:uncharacterized protein LOC116615008 isoform X2 [Nematostella vectensis]XP_048586319.1 uncharacterized protein LOC116615008 isoform X2 [Nematostella vectensis]
MDVGRIYNLHAFYLLIPWLIVAFGNAILRLEHSKLGHYVRFVDKRLNESIIATHHVMCHMDCAMLCTSHPRCLSFNHGTVPGGQNVCELLSSDGYSHGALNRLQENSSFSFYRENEAMESRSCLDYLKRGRTEDGIYLIHTPGVGHLHEVFCDFSTEPGWAWTLLVSFARKHRNKDAFCTVGYTLDSPSNEETPNLEDFRFSKQRMTAIRDHSTHLRATTNYKPGSALSYRDYIRGKISNLDLTSFTGADYCKKVDFISIRGIEGRDILVSFWQNLNSPLHIDPYFATCPFNAKQGSQYNENNFGNYCNDGEMSTGFSGSATEESTTQWWFGGNAYH